MANLAIIAAVSEYDRDAKPLPACKNDATLIRTILEHSTRFDEIYEVNTSEDSQSIKVKLANFIKKHHNTDIDEVLFYFSGHGDSQQDDAFLLLKDYQKDKLKQTSLSNSEIDDQIRSLNPKLFTKIIDSCHSVVSYVKNTEEFGELISKGKGKFQKVYFMFSSQQDQRSFTGDNVSYFTASFANTILNANNGPLRHRDIINGIADEFSSNNAQTPFFVAQADHTDIFIDVDVDIKKLISDIIARNSPPVSNKNDAMVLSIVEKIRKDAIRYSTKEEAMGVISNLKELTRRDYISTDIKELFVTQIDAVSEDVPGGRAIGIWLDNNDKEKKYFARPKSKQETYQKRVPKNPLSSYYTTSALGWLRGEPEEYALVSDVRTVIIGFNQTNDMDYEYIKIYLSPNFPNINPFECLIVPIFTTTQLRLFWSYAQLHHIDWDKWQRNSEITWKTDVCEMKNINKIEAIVESIAAGFQKFVEEPLRAAWDPPAIEEQNSGEN